MRALDHIRLGHCIQRTISCSKTLLCFLPGDRIKKLTSSCNKWSFGQRRLLLLTKRANDVWMNHWLAHSERNRRRDSCILFVVPSSSSASWQRKVQTKTRCCISHFIVSYMQSSTIYMSTGARSKYQKHLLVLHIWSCLLATSMSQTANPTPKVFLWHTISGIGHTQSSIVNQILVMTCGTHCRILTLSVIFYVKNILHPSYPSSTLWKALCQNFLNFSFFFDTHT